MKSSAKVSSSVGWNRDTVQNSQRQPFLAFCPIILVRYGWQMRTAVSALCYSRFLAGIKKRHPDSVMRAGTPYYL